MKKSGRKKGCIPWNKGIKGYKQPNISKALKGRKNPLIQGKFHYKWKGGKPNCILCGTKLSHYKLEYCLKHKRLNIGEKNWNWKGGITPENKRIRHTYEYILWRRAIFERDNYTCIWCGAKSQKGKAIILHADHIKPFCDYPELRFAIDNGRT